MLFVLVGELCVCVFVSVGGDHCDRADPDGYVCCCCSAIMQETNPKTASEACPFQRSPSQNPQHPSMYINTNHRANPPDSSALGLRGLPCSWGRPLWGRGVHGQEPSVPTAGVRGEGWRDRLHSCAFPLSMHVRFRSSSRIDLWHGSSLIINFAIHTA